MLEEAEYKIENLSKSICDIDIDEQGLWVGITEFSDNNQSLFFNGNRIDLSEKIRFPCVRLIDEETAFVADSRAKLNVKNGWIITSSGEIKSNFIVGDAIQDVIITKDFIVVTYFDESYGSSGIESNRLTVFDLEGNFLYGYMDTMNSVHIFDCYAASLVKDNKIIFFSYTDFPLVLLDVESKTEKIWQPPPEVAGSGAISKFGNKIYFHSPYKDEFGIYEWQIGDEKAEKVASYSNFLRGLPKGQFFAMSDSGYTIIPLQ